MKEKERAFSINIDRYQVMRGTWDTCIHRYSYPEGHKSLQQVDDQCFSSWEAAKSYIVSYLEFVLETRQYSAEVHDPPIPAIAIHPLTDQMEAEQRDYIEQLLEDIRQSKHWGDYFELRIRHDPYFVPHFVAIQHSESN